ATRREAIRMLDVNCPDCGRVLIGTRQIIAVTNGGDGIEVAYVCWCGRAGAERVGRPRRPISPGKKTTATGVRR
ncbi:MAG TPA: hypothetical protein VM844_11075, partial [Miltoncostaeaceae bacterium]|nr:hypothetical protein [Miltoncostaeaceae bacterium]